MGDLTLTVEGLLDILHVARDEISVLEQTTRGLRSIVVLCDGAGDDPLIRRHLDEIDRRLAVALVRQTSIASFLEERGRELRGEVQHSSTGHREAFPEYAVIEPEGKGADDAAMVSPLARAAGRPVRRRSGGAAAEDRPDRRALPHPGEAA